MKIYNKIIIEWNDETQSYDKVVYEDSYEYDGELMLADEACPDAATLDGHDHGWVIIGEGETAQCWLATNLETTVYSDGTGIDYYSEDEDTDWYNAGQDEEGAYTWNPDLDWGGYLYNWHAVNIGICPDRWWTPSDDEWIILEEFIGMCSGDGDGCSGDTGYRGTTEGGELKETGFAHWVAPNSGATNEWGFTALPAGYRSTPSGDYISDGISNFLWTSTSGTPDLAWYRVLGTDFSTLWRSAYNGWKTRGYSVRCITEPITVWPITFVQDIGGTITGDGTFEHGTVITITATPESDPDYTFVNLTSVPESDISCAADFGTAGVVNCTLSVVEAYTITAEFNANPVVEDQELETQEDTPLPISLSNYVSDVENDTVLYNVTSVPGHGIVENNGGGEVTYVPEDNWNSAVDGPDSFTFMATDAVSGANVEGRITINVLSVTDHPILTTYGDGLEPTDNRTTPEDIPYVTVVNYTYLGPGEITLDVESVSSDVDAVIDGDLLTVTPNPHWSGTADIIVTATGSVEGYADATFTLTVDPVNDPPVLAHIDNQEIDEDNTLTIPLSVSNVEGDESTITAESNDTNVTATLDGTNLILTPAEDWNGFANITVAVGEYCECGGGGGYEGGGELSKRSRRNPKKWRKTTSDRKELLGTVFEIPTKFVECNSWEGKKCIDAVIDWQSWEEMSPTDYSYPTFRNDRLDPREDCCLWNWLPENGSGNGQCTCTFGEPCCPGSDPGIEEEGVCADDGITPCDIESNIKMNCFFHPAAPYCYDEEIFILGVNPVGEGDIVCADIDASVDEDGSVSINLSCPYDAWDEHVPLGGWAISSPSYGTLEGTSTCQGPDCTVTYIPNDDSYADDSFTFSVTTNEGGVSTTGTVIIDVVQTFLDAPTCEDIDVSTDEDVPILITLVCSPTAGDPIDYYETLDPPHGELTGTAPNKTYTPDENFYGEDSFTYRACTESHVCSDFATVSITVDPVEDVPIAHAGEDETITGDYAPDSSSGLTYLASVLLDGSASYDVEESEFTFSWMDNDVEISTAETEYVDLTVGVHNITLTVTQVDDVNLFSSATVIKTVVANVYNVTADIYIDQEDEDATHPGQDHTIEDIGTITSSPEVLTGIPYGTAITLTANNEGSHAFLKWTDEAGVDTFNAQYETFYLESSVSFTATFEPTDYESPSSIFTLDIDGGYVDLTVAFTDCNESGSECSSGGEADAVIQSWSWNFGDGCTAIVELDGGAYTVTSNCPNTTWIDQNPTHIYTTTGLNRSVFVPSLTVTDSYYQVNTSSYDTGIIVATVLSLDSISTQHTYEEVAKEVELVVAGDTPSIAIDIDEDNTDNVALLLNGTTLTLTPVEDFWCDDVTIACPVITVTATDEHAGADWAVSIEQQFTLTIGPIQDVPILTAINSQSTDEDNPLVITLEASQAFGETDTLTFTAVSDQPVNVVPTITNQQGTGDWSADLTLTPADNFWCDDVTITCPEITVEVTNTGGGSDSDSFILSVTPVNDPPTIVLPDSFTFAEDGSLAENFSGYVDDIDNVNSALTLTVADNVNVIVSISGQSVTFSAAPDWFGTETLTFTVDDGFTNCGGPCTASDDVDVIVAPVNDPPIANAGDVQTVNGNVTVTLNGAGSSDPEGDFLYYTWSGEHAGLLDDVSSIEPSFTAPRLADPEAAFSAERQLGNYDDFAVPMAVQFTDTTVFEGAITSWSWDFGDGETSLAQHPLHTYTVAGDHSVTLTVSTSTSDTYNFVLTVNDGNYNCGDGSQLCQDSDANNITVNNLYSDTSDAEIITADPHYPPTAVLFTDTEFLAVKAIATNVVEGTTGQVTTHQYDFGDGCTAYYIDNVYSWNGCNVDTTPGFEIGFIHKYDNDETATYTITLTVIDELGESNTYTADVTVEAIHVDFSADRVFGLPPLIVEFTDQSELPDGTGLLDIERTISTWSWTFGDGGTSTEQNPIHTYADIDLYTVTLVVVSNDGYTVTLEIPDYINVTLIQSVSSQYAPWQGINVIGDYTINDSTTIEDLDTRPRLGMFYWTDEQPDSAWSAWNGGVLQDLLQYGFPNWPDEMPAEWYKFACYSQQSGHTQEADEDCRYESQECGDDGYSHCEYGWNWGGTYATYQEIHDGVDGNIKFTPDADARLVSSIEKNIDVPLFQYYDRKLSPVSYINSTAPANVQFLFYLREFGNDNVFEERAIKSLTDEDPFYIAWINWDDGSPLEFLNPVPLIDNQRLFHSYENWGIYNVTGYILHPYHASGFELGDLPRTASTIYFRKFFLNINLNKSIGYTDEFKAVGGNDHTYIPYDDTASVIGGVSDNSLYYKTVEKIADGFVDDDGSSYMDRRDDLRSQIAFNNIDDRFIGPELLQFIGSYNTVDATIYNDDFETPFSSEELKGFFSGSNWDSVDGSVTAPVLIHYGYGRTPQELGDHLGDVDIGQVRLFKTGSLDMWQILGFENSNAGNPGTVEYWKNIIPEGYLLSNREGVEVEGEVMSITPGAEQYWNEGYYYPVLPRVNKFGEFDYTRLGLQNSNTPFGSPNREWDGDDETASITNPDLENPDLIIDFDFSSISNGVLGDNSGNENFGILLNDFKVKLNSDVHPNSVKFPNRAKLEKKSREQAF